MRVYEITREILESGGEIIYEDVRLFQDNETGIYRVTKGQKSFETRFLTDAFERFDAACFVDDMSYEDGEDWTTVSVS